MPYNAQGEWKPHKKQEIFMSLPDSIKEAAYLGGAGSAKSETLLMLPIVRGFYKMDGFKQVFMRRTYPELEREIIPRAKRLYAPFGGKYTGGEHKKFEFPSGAIIFMGHCENEDDVHKYDSMEINLFTPDEITSFTEWQYIYVAFERVRAARGSGLPALIRVAGMPGGVGHTWVKKRFVDPAPHGSKILIGKGGIKRIMVFATQADNPHIDQDYKNSLEALPEAEKNAKLYGSFDAYLGQVFDEFRDKHYSTEPDNAIHVIEPFEIPSYWPRIVIGDWGYSAMTWIGFGAISPDRRLYVYRECGFRKTKIEVWANEIRPLIDADNPRVIKFCKSAGQDRGQEHTIQSQIEEAIGRPIELSNNTAGSRIAGKTLLHEYLRWQPKKLHAREIKEYDENYSQWLLRNRGLDEYRSYLSSFNPPEEETNIPKLQIFSTCDLLVTAIKTCSYAKAGSDGKPKEDVAEFDGDDPYDGIRYMVDAADRYFEDSKKEFDKVVETEKIIKTVEENKDWTMFYRNANTMETKSRNLGVRRYHRGRM